MTAVTASSRPQTTVVPIVQAYELTLGEGALAVPESLILKAADEIRARRG